MHDERDEVTQPLRLAVLDPAEPDAPSNVPLRSVVGIATGGRPMARRFGRVLKPALLGVFWLGSAAGATSAVWTVQDMLRGDAPPDEALYPNTDRVEKNAGSPAPTPTLLPNIPQRSTDAPAAAGAAGNLGQATAGSSQDAGDGVSSSPADGRDGSTTERSGQPGSSVNGSSTNGSSTNGTSGPGSIGTTGGNGTLGRPATTAASSPATSPKGGGDTTPASDSPRTNQGPGTTSANHGPPNTTKAPDPETTTATAATTAPATTPTTAGNGNPGPGGGNGGGGNGGGGGGGSGSGGGATGTLGSKGGTIDVRCATSSTITLTGTNADAKNGYTATVVDAGTSRVTVRFTGPSTVLIQAHCANNNIVRDA